MPEYPPDKRYRPEPESDENVRVVRNAIGIALIGGGALLAYWVCTTIYGVFNDPEKLEVFNRIVALGPELREMEVQGQKVILPRVSCQPYIVGLRVPQVVQGKAQPRGNIEHISSGCNAALGDLRGSLRASR